MYLFLWSDVSDAIAAACLSIAAGHLSLVIFSHAVNPSLFNMAEAQAFISKHRIALLQFPLAMDGKYICFTD